MQEKHLSQVIRQRLEAGKVRYWAGDNISDYVDTDDKKHRSRLLEA